MDEETKAKTLRIAQEKINFSIAYLISRFPVLAQIFYEKLTLKVDWNHPTGWVNGVYLAFNPAFIAGLIQAHVDFFLMHEINHPMLLHHIRRGNRDHKLWNVACDYADNALLYQEGFDVPKDALLDERFFKLTAEEIYDILLSEIKQGKDPRQSGNQSQPGGGQSQDNTQQAKSEEEIIDELFEDSSKYSGEVHDAPSDVKELSKKEEEQKADEQSDAGEPQEAMEIEDYEYVPEESVVEPEDYQEEFDNWTSVVVRATEGAKMHGQGSVKTIRAVEAVRKAPIDVYEVLKEFMERPAKSEPDWAKPKKRLLQYNRKWYLPSLGGMEMGKIYICGDMSGSVSVREDRVFFKVFEDVIVHHPVDDLEIVVIQFDHEVLSVTNYTKNDMPIKWERHGNGGTCFQAPIDYINRVVEDGGEDDVPACVMFLTDMGAMPIEEQDYPIMWVATQWNPQWNAQFPGEHVFLPVAGHNI